MRVFPDTNVLLAALATRGLCADLMRTLLAEHEVIIGEPVMTELERGLRVKLKMTPSRVALAMSFANGLVRAPSVRNAPSLGINDRGDDHVVACAIAAGVDCIVTGDGDLLSLERVGSVDIVSPRQLWDRLRQTSAG